MKKFYKVTNTTNTTLSVDNLILPVAKTIEVTVLSESIKKLEKENKVLCVLLDSNNIGSVLNPISEYIGTNKLGLSVATGDKLSEAKVVDKTALFIALQLADSLNEADYATNSWENLITEKVNGQITYETENVSQLVVDAATDGIYIAIDQLVNITLLVAAIQNAESLDSTKYTSSSWLQVSNQLVIANNTLADAMATQPEVDTATNDLNYAVSQLVAMADRSELVALIYEYDNVLNLNDYTTYSWLEYSDVIDGARDVVADEYIDQAGIDDEIEEVLYAKADLVSVVALKNAISNAEELEESDYTPASWAPFSSAFDTATGSVLFDGTQTEVDTATNVLINAQNNLVLRADKTQLNIRITQYGTLDLNDYTPNSWNPYSSSIDAAIIVRDNLNATQLQVDNATQAAANNFNSLVLRANKSALVEQLNYFDTLNLNDYTPNSWAPYAQDISDGVVVNNNLNATQTAVDTVVGEIISTRGDLILRADFSSLQNLVDEFHNRTDSADFTTASWYDYLVASEAGELVLANLNATQQQVNDSVSSINTTKNNLVYIADLENAILAAQAYAEVDYTPGSWAPFASALSVAENAVMNAATQLEVDTATNNLISAQNNLILRADFSSLQNLVDEFHNRTDSTNYTVASWNDYSVEIDGGELVLADLNSTQQQVDNSVVAVNLAKSNLIYIVDLENAILAAHDYSEENYTPVSWTPFASALSTAENVVTSGATQLEVDTAESNLVNAQGNLNLRANKSALVEQLNYFDTLDSDDYTPNSWTPYAQDISDGVGVNSDLNATQTAVDNAVQEIISTRANLVLRADFSSLQNLVDEFHNRNDSADFTTASWGDYLSAVNAGELVLADLNSTQQQVNDSVVAINLAKSNLVYIVDLEAAILDAHNYLEADYTPESWAPFAIALSTAESVVMSATTQQEVDTAENNLTDAQNNLVPNE